ncbi:MAG: hypothetical protein PHV23_05275 [Candidatus Gracilibacteria bacterium]|nr:hypothetical protein [Candidatus Gracilibacteria bacterium]
MNRKDIEDKITNSIIEVVKNSQFYEKNSIAKVNDVFILSIITSSDYQTKTISDVNAKALAEIYIVESEILTDIMIKHSFVYYSKIIDEIEQITDNEIAKIELDNLCSKMPHWFKLYISYSSDNYKDLDQFLKGK